VTKASQFTGTTRPAGNTPPVRPESTIGDDRPFAEIRKNLQDGLRMLSLHRWAFIVPFSMVTSGAFILSLYYPRTYTATTTFERRNDPIMVDLPVKSEATSFRYFRSTMARDLTSVAYMSDVVDNLRLTEEFEKNPDGTLTPVSMARRTALAQSLGSRLRITSHSPNEHVDIVELTYTGPDAKIGASLLDEVKRTYIRRTMAWIHEFLQSQRDYFLNEQAEALEALKLAEQDQTRLRLESPYANPRDPAAMSTKLTQLEIERKELDMRRRDYQTDLSALKQLLVGINAREGGSQALSPSGLPDADAAPFSQASLRLRSEIHDIQAKVGELRRTRGMTDEHPEIQALLEKQRVVSGELETQRHRDRENPGADGQGMDASSAAALSSAPMPWDTERARLLVQIEVQESKIRDIDISVRSNEMETAQLNKAKDEIYEKQAVFADISDRIDKVRKRHNEASAALARIGPAIRAIEQDRLLSFSEGQPARGSSIPVNPRASTIVLLAIVAGVIAGVIFVVLAEVLDHVYRSSGQVARSLGLPILDSIDVIITAQDRRRLLVQRSVLAPLLIIACLALTGITGSMAYFSIQRPWAYQRIKRLPEDAMKHIAGTEAIGLPDVAPGIS